VNGKSEKTTAPPRPPSPLTMENRVISHVKIGPFTNDLPLEHGEKLIVLLVFES
jgi:hypothetical protein